jgi:hypothetical protein
VLLDHVRALVGDALDDVLEILDRLGAIGMQQNGAAVQPSCLARSRIDFSLMPCCLAMKRVERKAPLS